MKSQLLIIGKVWPEPDSTAAGVRMLQLLRAFKESGWSIKFVSHASSTEFSADLADMNISTEQIQLNDSSFDAFVKNLNPDAVMFDRFTTEEQYGWRIAECCPEAVRILDTEDLHFLRQFRKNSTESGSIFDKKDLTNNFSIREIASIYRCDLSLIISSEEFAILKDLFNIDSALLHYVPFLYQPGDRHSFDELPDYAERSHFMTIGNFRHAPNMDSVEWMKRDIWPLIREELPEAELHIYGSYESKKVKQLHSEEEGFLIRGRAIRVQDVMCTCRVLLAPLRYGAGLKGKIADALRFGTPFVTTPIGAEGLLDEDKQGFYVADNPRKIAKAAITLYSDKKKWKKAALSGLKTFDELFLDPDHISGFQKKIESIKSDLDSHRKRNFIGRMLLHHSMNATKYMSRWIEEKNRIQS